MHAHEQTHPRAAAHRGVDTHSGELHVARAVEVREVHRVALPVDLWGGLPDGPPRVVRSDRDLQRLPVIDTGERVVAPLARGHGTLRLVVDLEDDAQALRFARHDHASTLPADWRPPGPGGNIKA